MAEGVGFEPTELLHSTVFKTAAFNHSAIPPAITSFELVSKERKLWFYVKIKSKITGFDLGKTKIFIRQGRVKI